MPEDGVPERPSAPQLLGHLIPQFPGSSTPLLLHPFSPSPAQGRQGVQLPPPPEHPPAQTQEAAAPPPDPAAHPGPEQDLQVIAPPLPSVEQGAQAPRRTHQRDKEPYQRPPGLPKTGSHRCPHGRKTSVCKDCGGVSICDHGRQRSACKECGGGSICEHGKQRFICKDCAGNGICHHNRIKWMCKPCGGTSICKHNRQKHQCKDCGFKKVCPHGRQKSICKECGGSGLCVHDKVKSQCKECSTSFCVHGRRKGVCKDCGGKSVCQHGRIKSICKDCGGGSICEHGKIRSRCKKTGECSGTVPTSSNTTQEQLKHEATRPQEGTIDHGSKKLMDFFAQAQYSKEVTVPAQFSTDHNIQSASDMVNPKRGQYLGPLWKAITIGRGSTVTALVYFEQPEGGAKKFTVKSTDNVHVIKLDEIISPPSNSKRRKAS
mmetsp:Transcript_21043/g.32986  ORF Transcript_21043/g.32986 Transcript_21043/m.32986 type:complete len:432 (+) Transcript_21043:93-1388(+)